MSKDPLTNPARRPAYELLFNITSTLYNNPHLEEFNIKSDNKLETLDDVQIEPLVLDEASPQRPSYFACYPSHLLSEPPDNVLEAFKRFGTDIGEDDDNPEDPFYRPVDRAYQVYQSGLNIYMTHYQYKVRRDNVPWVTRW